MGDVWGLWVAVHSCAESVVFPFPEGNCQITGMTMDAEWSSMYWNDTVDVVER